MVNNLDKKYNYKFKINQQVRTIANSQLIKADCVGRIVHRFRGGFGGNSNNYVVLFDHVLRTELFKNGGHQFIVHEFYLQGGE